MKIKLGCLVLAWKCKPRLRLVPGFKDLREQTVGTLPTPQHVGCLARKERCLLASIQIKDSEQFTNTIGFTDKRDNPTSAPIGAAPPQWLVDNPNLLALQPAPDGLSCLVKAVGPLGDATVSVKVTDAQENTLAAGSIDVHIVSGAPTKVVITPGTPEEQP